MRWHALAGLSVVCSSLVLTGCGSIGDTDKVTGTVTFSDGTPLTKGLVIFANPEATAQGEIQSDGRYTLGSFEASDGAPAGSYGVFLAGPIFGAQGQEPAARRPVERGLEAYDEGIPQMGEAMVHRKFNAPGTSGLTCEVSGTTTFDITVERPE